MMRRPAAQLLLLCASMALLVGTALGGSCDGPMAMYRYQWVYKLKSPTDANLKAVHSLVDEWMALPGCSSVVREGHSRNLLPAPGDPYVGDYGAWMDIDDLSDLAACYQAGIASGVLLKMRAYTSGAARNVYLMNTNPGMAKIAACRKDSPDPAGFRFMTWTCFKNTTLLQPTMSQLAKVMAQASEYRMGMGMSSKPVRGQDMGIDLVDDLSLFGVGTVRTSDVSSFHDFRTVAQVKMAAMMALKARAAMSDATETIEPSTKLTENIEGFLWVVVKPSPSLPGGLFGK